ncbi:Fpg/Nei family DNA glycosylase [Actinocorallia longicatena]|uniref:DNA-(apurinic or apyrimidinic site) lyase n=1 Tax=Actinocorallia longicatena TaxID=111803 RepID=A0ABP6Q8Z5_9ACTN
MPRHATADLTGRKIVEVVPRGKHLLMRMPDLTLHSHLLMDGSWRIFRSGERWRGPGHQIRAILEVPAASVVGYRIHDLRLVRPADERLIVGHLGPDLLGPDWDAELAVHNLWREPSRPIAEALLEQRNLAGIGNVFKSEILFVSRTSPWAPVQLSDLPQIVENSSKLLLANRETRVRNTTGSLRDPVWVYGRAGRPCLRCGTPIRSAELAGRVTYWCPECQR